MFPVISDVFLFKTTWRKSARAEPFDQLKCFFHSSANQTKVVVLLSLFGVSHVSCLYTLSIQYRVCVNLDKVYTKDMFRGCKVLFVKYVNV